MNNESRFHHDRICTEFGIYEYAEIDTQEGATYIMLRGDNVMKLPPDVNVGEKTVRVDDDVVADHYFMGNARQHIEAFEIAIGLRKEA